MGFSPNDVAAVRERYARFARDEAPGRSALYEEWAAGVAADARVAEVLASISPHKRQPPLVFAVTRMLGATLGSYDEWAEWVIAHEREIVEECSVRGVQTNEPLRCAALLPALSQIAGPIALLEIGASAGLCLYPDRYSYRYAGAAGSASLDPSGGQSSVVLDIDLRGSAVPPLALPDIIWRAGIDLQPMDARLPQDRAWLRGLVWPGETGREQRIDAALQIAADDPPMLFAGDALARLAEVAALAPAAATLVVTTPGVLVHIGRAARDALIASIRAICAERSGHWITLDAPGLHEAVSGEATANGWPEGGFAVALDSEVRGAADPLGRWVEWRAGTGAIAP